MSYLQSWQPEPREKNVHKQTHLVWIRRYFKEYPSLLNLMYMAKSSQCIYTIQLSCWVSNSNWKRMVPKWSKYVKVWQKKMMLLSFSNLFMSSSSWSKSKVRKPHAGDFDQAGSWMPCILGQYFPGMFASAGPSRTKKEGSAGNIFAELGTPLKSSCLSRSAKICKDFQQNINPDTTTAYTNHLKRQICIHNVQCRCAPLASWGITAR